MAFGPEADLLFDYDQILRGHASGMKLIALDEHGAEICREIYYSIGGGFVVTAAELEAGRDGAGGSADSDAVPFPFRTAEEMRAEDGRRQRAVHCRDETRQLSSPAATAKPNWTRASTASGR